MNTALSPTISNERPAWTASDWNALRAAGLAYIEKYAHGLWTDYNRHDPGVTILELLCYAITDLSQRTSLEMKDLMRSSYANTQDLQAAFPGPDQVLPGPPVTLLDYRKLLLDVPGVRNVWLVPNAGSPVHINRNTAVLEPYNKDIVIGTGTNQRSQRVDFTLRGLYDIRVDVDSAVIASLKKVFIDDKLDDIQLLPVKAPAIRPLRNLDLLDNTTKADALDLAAQHIREVKIGELQDVTWSGEAIKQTSVQARKLLVTDDLGVNGGVDSLPTAPATDGGIRPDLVAQEFNTVKFATVDLGGGKVLPVSEFPVPVSTETDLSVRAEKNAITELTNLVKQMYLNYRNLGEDFVEVKLVQTEPVAIAAEIELLPGANLATVHAQVLLAFDQYLAPVVKRYSLAEMQALTDANGQPLRMEEIFEGPRLQRGFIRNEELAATELRPKVFASDLIALARAVPGVRAVNSLTLPESLVADKLTQDIPAGSRPELKLERQGQTLYPQLTFTQAGRQVSTLTNRPAALKQYEALRATYVAAQDRTIDPLPLLEGTAYDLLSYRPLALDLPATYGAGPGTLSPQAPIGRRNQARQLRAYLLFFDQLLANYLAQLVHAKDLFSTDMQAPATYFGQRLDHTQFPELAELYESFETLTPALVAQTSDTRLEGARKSRFVDHLLARFAESFAEYGLMLYSAAEPRNDWDQLLVKSRLAADQPRFAPGRAFQYHVQSWMGDYDPIAPARGGTKWVNWAIRDNYILSPVNDAVAVDNVAGIVRRFGRLVGMSNFTARRQATRPTGSAVMVKGKPGDSGHRVDYYVLYDQATSTDEEPYAVSAETYSAGSASTIAGTTNALAPRRSAWEVYEVKERLAVNFTFEVDNSSATEPEDEETQPRNIQTSNQVPVGKFVLRLLSDATPREPLAYVTKVFDNAFAAEQHLSLLLNSLHTAGESILLIEHILLRPTSTTTAPKLWLLPGGPRQQACWPLDPYSYCITVLLPGYTPRFSTANPDERKYAARVLHSELPAHILADIRWIESPTDMAIWETAYRNWATYKRTGRGPEAQDALVTLLNGEAPPVVVRKFSDAFAPQFS